MLHFFLIFCMVGSSFSLQNLAGLIGAERQQNYPDTGNQNDFRFDVYHRFEEISAYIDSVGKRYPEIAEVQRIGRTYEGNPLKGLKIGSRVGIKPVILIDACFHAREWVTPATALYIINQLVARYDNDSDIREMVDTFDWYIFPVMNPDGYKYSWTPNNRLWRKNRSPASVLFPLCRGVDINRNFPVDFGGESTSRDPCNDFYPGLFPFSEAESRATRDFILRTGDRLKSYITLHAFSQDWLTPYGYTRDLPPDYEDHVKALDVACDAVRNVHRQNYTCGTIANVKYPASGSATDWSYIHGKIKYSIAVEMRDTGKFGYVLPRDQIIPTAEENFAGIKAFVGFLKSQI